MTKSPNVIEDLIRATVPIAIAGIAIIGYVYFGVRAVPESAVAKPIKAVVVKTVEAIKFDRPIEIVVDGVAQPHRHISIAAEVSGRVKFKNPSFNDGNFLKAGEILYEIDPADYESAVQRIKEELRQAENALEEWEVDRSNALEQIQLSEDDLAFATREADRLRSLRDNNATSTADLEQSMRSEISAKTALLGLKNQVRVLDARKSRAVSIKEFQAIQLSTAERNLERTKIFAPVDCIVVTDDCEQGGYVQPGKVVAILNDVEKAEVACQLELDDLYWLWTSRSLAEISAATLDAGAAYNIPPLPVVIEFPFHDRTCRWSGVISRFGGTGIDLSTRTIPCRITVDKPSQATVVDAAGNTTNDIVPPPLSTGMFVSVRISVAPRVELVELPSTAVRSGGVTWLMRDHKLKIQPVKIARRMRDFVLVHMEPDGVQAGDCAIVSPLAVAEEGMALQEQSQ